MGDPFEPASSRHLPQFGRVDADRLRVCLVNDGTPDRLSVVCGARNSWARKRDMPAGGFGGTTGVIKGKLYVVTSTAAGPV